MVWVRRQRIRVLLGLILTFGSLHFIPDRLAVLIFLTLSWSVLFFPLSAGELVAFVVAALFFLLQNYVCLKAGLFEFRFKDILLMPAYEPSLWGFYFLSMRRFNSAGNTNDAVFDTKSVAGLAVTSIVFSLFAFDSRGLFIATACSTTFLFVLFHTKLDIQYAVYALTLGFVVELFGVSTGLWWYAAPDFLGIPYWFATMWISVGLLGRRSLFPASEWLAGRVRAHRA